MYEGCVVVGAGISGLALAYELRQRGIEPLVLEAASRAGGVIRSVRRGSYLSEAGPASVQATPALVALVRELGLAERVQAASPVARRRCILAGGRVLSVPETVGEFVRTPLLSAPAKLRALADVVLPRAAGDGSVAELIRRRLGRKAAERLILPLLSSVYAGDPEMLCALHAFGWLTSHRSLLLARLRGLLPPAEASLVSFPEGLGELVSALASSLGAAVRLGAQVRMITAARAGFHLVVEDASGGHMLTTRMLAIATPARAAAHLLEGLDVPAAEALRRFRTAPISVVHLAYPKAAFPVPPAAYGLYPPPSEPTWLAGAVFPSLLFPGRAPEGEILTLVRLGGARDPELAHLGLLPRIATARQALTRAFRLRGDPTFRDATVREVWLPQYELGHADRLAEVEAIESRHPGLFVTGNAYRGASVPACIATAARVAERIREQSARLIARGASVAAAPETAQALRPWVKALNSQPD